MPFYETPRHSEPRSAPVRLDYFGRLAQLVRAADLHSAGRGFESLSAHTSAPTRPVLESNHLNSLLRAAARIDLKVIKDNVIAHEPDHVIEVDGGVAVRRNEAQAITPRPG